MRVLRAIAVTATVVVGGSAGAGCDDCPDDYDCPASGVHVDWEPSKLPMTSRASVCVDGDCEDNVRSMQGAPLGSASGPASARGRVSVRLDLYDSSGELIASIRGEGKVEGGCCGPHLFMRATSDGRRLEPTT